jgi:hypothetical protein
VDNGDVSAPDRPTVAVMSFAAEPEHPGAALPAAVPTVAPPAVPGYRLEALLGRGGSGEVWRAVPRRGGAPVAVKVLVAGDPERQAREAALLGELDHPHLVRLLEVVHQPCRGAAPRVALVLELLAGGSMAALLARRGRLRPGEVVTAIAPVAAALAHAHGNGVVHGDLSPGNIVFTAEGRPVLTDLGVARVLGETPAGEVTPAYVDPTVARGGAPGPASDVFGVAAAAFHALTGVAPWNAATPGDTLTVAATGQLPDLTELAPEAPRALVEVIARGLAADPHDRGSAAAFALDLRHACRPEPVRLPAPGIPDAELGRTGRGARTELTHQVPGRRPRPAPVVAEPARRRDRRRAVREAVQQVWAGRLRPVTRRGGVLGLGVAGLAVVAWLVAGGLGGDADGPSGATVAAATSAPPSVTAASGAPSSVGESEPVTAADLPEVPTSPEAWRAVVADLYQRRAQAFATAEAGSLSDVYTPGSAQLAADRAHARTLADAGEMLRGFAPEVLEVTAAGESGGRAEVELVDRWADYEVVRAAEPEGPAARTVPGRSEAGVQMVLVRTDEGWRIESARRLA